ncbi:Inner membrane protein YjgN [compost metagenome]
MTDAVYAVVFRGEVLEDFSRAQVQASFARLLGLNAERSEQLFTQPRTVLKKGLGHAEAVRYREALQRLGAVVSVEAAIAQPAPPPGVPQQPPRQPATATRAAPLSLQDDDGDSARVQGDGAPPAAANAGSKAAASAAPRELAFEFRGEGFEFFRIWIVNILLSIVTLGIYSAWAKVRTQRYFYGNTQLDGSSFDYLADPVKILKGRLIAFACLVVYSVAGELSMALGAVMGLLLLVALPWIIVRGLSFRNSNSAWRGVRFGFDGSYGGAAMAFLVWPLLGALTLGILMPLAMHKQQRFIAGNSRYGTSCFQLDVGARPFYMIFLAMLGIGVAAGALVAVLSGLSPLLASAVGAVTYLLLFAFFNVRFTNLVYGNLALGDNHLVSQYELGSYSVLMLVNMLGMLLTLGLFYPWAKVRNARYAAEHMALVAGDDLDGFIAARRQEVSSLGGEFAEMFDVGLAL